MDAAQVAAFAAALAALPINAFLIIIIVMLWRRLVAVTDLLIDARPMKTDDANKVVSASSPDAGAAPVAPAAPIVFAQTAPTTLPEQ